MAIARVVQAYVVALLMLLLLVIHHLKSNSCFLASNQGTFLLVD